MPGIVGLHTRMSREWAEVQLKLMVERLQHESFYIAGTWVDESLGLYVGWVARRNSFSEDMPLRNADGNLTLIFSGEDFSDPESNQDRSPSGIRGMASPSSYLVRRAESETNFPCGLNGRFHGLLADRVRGTTTLFNDRYGMHRLYYHQSKEAVYFSAEAKAILAVRPELRRIEPRAFGEYVTCGCVLENRTLFEGIAVLPGGSKWALKNGSVECKETYFQPREWEEQERLDPESYYQILQDIFISKLSRYFVSNEPIGMSLTGGLDSRMIMAWHKPRPRTLPCYTFGGMYRDCQDVVVARQVARICEQPYEVIDVGKDFLSRFHHYAERAVYLTDGCADVRRASDLYLNERVREIASVRMTGNYGSEVLRGVRAFKPNRPVPGLFSQDVLPYLSQAEETYYSLLLGHPVSFAVFKQAPWHHYGLLALEETQVSIRSPYLDNDLVQTVFRAPQSALATYDVCLNLIANGNPVLRDIPTDRGVGRKGMAGRGLRKWEEVLVKSEYAFDYGMPQWLARINHAVSVLHLERMFLGRHKFNHYRVWYQDVLSDYVRQILLDPRTLSRPYVQRSQIEAIVQEHLSGSRNHTNEIHVMLTLELLHRVLIDKP
ncbi:Asparagine synthase [Candidatus Nitrospira nitrosa]|uniref:asparagine synthase (glutamine-hydrolyzing) n=1 Tax=Candidatus Nitrospira nitrosa TaxID=1742972 RepID=A0A0S4LG41_9BACT|nr:asparagine synthase-related protein [Candidatus Nitrospira nitrosa]CUS36545.1 Asparagine synthase [Candidatus Nitrospira nitrosa]